MAETMIREEQGYVTLDPDPAGLAPEQPFEPIAVQRTYQDELRRYFDYKITYYPGYDRPLAVSQLTNWASFIDIHDEVVDEKFPIDRDIRAYITAFRLSLQRNYRRFILRRRIDQLILLTVLMLPLALWTFMPELRPEGVPMTFAAIPDFLMGTGRDLALGVGALYAASFGILLYNLSTNRQVLASTMHANAGDLKAKVQRRINSLHQGYVHCVKAVNEAELNAGLNDETWIDDSKYWAQLALWKPKRIEYIEKFYQSEMQRNRVSAFRWRVGMRIIGWLMVAATIALAGVLGFITRDPVGMSLAGIVATLGFVHYRVLLSKPYMVEITDIKRFIGDNDWKRFSDINFDEDFADIIRRDKMRIRQEKARGGVLGMGGRAA
ncbi:MAG: hypothetical protein AAF830_00065 [Pseudomonadota bacterium]